MAANYYLMNGQKGEGNALNLLVDGNLQKSFIDISTLDLQTMNISSTKVAEILQEYNPRIDLQGIFYNASYPHTKTNTKTYAPIFNFESEIVKYYMTQLKYFAEQRNYKKTHGLNIKLDEDTKLEDYIRGILYNILNKQESKLTNYESLMSAKLKEIIKNRYKEYFYMGTNNYINSRIYLLRNLLSSYTELRNLTLEYMLYIQGLNTNLRTTIKNTEHWNNKGMEKTLPIKYTKENNITEEATYYQMQLSDFMADVPPINRKVKRK